ncbi:hypothetical protein IFM89_008906 [Coptis chinensis]|uniref:Uncharacterized protein n=1 Tax=Coptis chinensis TaxID=261450 RepID=A0A835H1Z3_9MAGN|nr:hypothetical protein IFM89_008906 [Coptis chinensis]
MLGGALTGAIVSAGTNSSRDKVVMDAIAGGAIAILRRSLTSRGLKLENILINFKALLGTPVDNLWPGTNKDIIASSDIIIAPELSSHFPLLDGIGIDTYITLKPLEEGRFSQHELFTEAFHVAIVLFRQCSRLTGLELMQCYLEIVDLVHSWSPRRYKPETVPRCSPVGDMLVKMFDNPDCGFGIMDTLVNLENGDTIRYCNFSCFVCHYLITGSYFKETKSHFNLCSKCYSEGKVSSTIKSVKCSFKEYGNEAEAIKDKCTILNLHSRTCSQGVS